MKDYKYISVKMYDDVGCVVNISEKLKTLSEKYSFVGVYRTYDGGAGSFIEFIVEGEK